MKKRETNTDYVRWEAFGEAAAGRAAETNQNGQKNENQKTEKAETGEKVPRRQSFVTLGICICLLLSVIFTSLYSVFGSLAAQNSSSPIESVENITWLYRNSMLLYRELYNKVNHTDLNFQELYLAPTEGNEWIWDDVARTERMEKDQPDENSNSADLYSCLTGLDGHIGQYFEAMEDNFIALNNFYDYLIEDLDSGEYVSNLTSREVELQDQHFYLGFQFDSYGNVTVLDEIIGEDIISIRKNASAAIRNSQLEESVQAYLEDMVFNGISPRIQQLFTVNTPKNCRVIFCISNADWETARKAGDAYYIDGNGMDDGAVIRYYRMSEASQFQYSGIMGVLMILAGIAFAAALFLPAAGKQKPWKCCKIFQMSLEVTVIFGIILLGAGAEALISLAYQVESGHLLEMLVGAFAAEGVVLLEDVILPGLVYGINLLCTGLFFFGMWLLGIYVSGLKDGGLLHTLKNRSLLYRFFPFIRKKLVGMYDAVSHFDVTQKAHRMILKLVLVNAVLLFLISSLWFGGFSVAVIYSIVLYIVLRKYISDLQKKYGILLGGINKIANGDLNVEITEDLGVFEPFKPQIIRIQRGFSKALEEEVKSQRMKTELITNVSHDLKTPLTAIITYIDLLKDESITQEQRKEYLDTLERKSLRLKVLIEDLFEVSKANSQNITLNIEQVDLINLLKQVVFEMEDKIKGARLDLRMKLPEQKVILPLDPQKTYRIYENLLGNVAKYAMPGTRIYLDGALQEDELIVSLKNITAEEICVDASELTERFVRGDKSRNTEGSGLGLAIAKSFTDLQGGQLSVQIDGDLFKVVTVWKFKKDLERG